MTTERTALILGATGGVGGSRNRWLLGVWARSCAPRGDTSGGARFRAKARWLEASSTSSSRQLAAIKANTIDQADKAKAHSHTPRPSSPRGSGSLTTAFRDVLRHNVMPCHPNDRLTD